MKKLLTVIAFLLPLSIVHSQPLLTNSNTIDERLYAVFDKQYLESVKTDDPMLLERWHFYLDNAFLISDSPPSKNEKTKTYPSVLIADLSNINILKLEKEQDLKHDFYAETIYKIEGTQQFLIYLPGRDFVEKFNAHWHLKISKQ